MIKCSCEGERTNWGAERNYDLNIWNVGWNEGKRSKWQISPYQIPECGQQYYEYEVKPIILTAKEAKSLTLGVSEEKGGDYTEDEDFVIDLAHFYITYNKIPERVKAYLDKLPAYPTPLNHEKENN